MQIVTTERDARAADALKWRDAINDALTNWLSPIEDHEAPADALQRLIRLEINAALDPAVLQSAAER
jgi:anti-sigma factor RsiW